MPSLGDLAFETLHDGSLAAQLGTHRRRFMDRVRARLPQVIEIRHDGHHRMHSPTPVRGESGPIRQRLRLNLLPRFGAVECPELNFLMLRPQIADVALVR